MGFACVTGRPPTCVISYCVSCDAWSAPAWSGKLGAQSVCHRKQVSLRAIDVLAEENNAVIGSQLVPSSLSETGCLGRIVRSSVAAILSFAFDCLVGAVKTGGEDWRWLVSGCGDIGAHIMLDLFDDCWLNPHFQHRLKHVRHGVGRGTHRLDFVRVAVQLLISALEWSARRST